MAGGRPTKLTPAVQRRILGDIRSGDYIETAAARAGISRSTLFDWLRKGARARYKKDGTPYKEDAPYVEFSVAVEKARAEAEHRDLRVINDAAGGKVRRTISKRKYEVRHDADGNEIRVLVEEVIEERSGFPEWTAAAWKLERRSPSRFGRKLPKNIEPDDVDLDNLNDEELERIAQGEDIDTVLADAGRRRAQEEETEEGPADR